MPTKGERPADNTVSLIPIPAGAPGVIKPVTQATE